jgi:hypothetical protein
VFLVVCHPCQSVLHAQASFGAVVQAASYANVAWCSLDDLGVASRRNRIDSVSHRHSTAASTSPLLVSGISYSTGEPFLRLYVLKTPSLDLPKHMEE